MKKVLLISLICYSNFVFGQTQNLIISDQPFNGNTSYSSHSIHIDSVSELPLSIQYNLDRYLKKILGDFHENTTFSHGQIVDLNNYFKKDSVTYIREWIVPKYDLNFKIINESIGIKSYYLQIQMDQYGQILSINWPKSKYNSISNFKSRDLIFERVINSAKQYILYHTYYKTQLEYDKNSDKIFLLFIFPDSLKPSNKMNYVIKADWLTGEVLDNYQIFTSVVH